MFGRLQRILLATTALIPLSFTPAAANPQGAHVVGGSATVQGQGTPQVTVHQSSDRAIINWKTFNIGANEKTQFVQPSSSSVTLNRVTGGLGPSQIYGSLSANGRIFVVNPDGILIGSGAKIDTAGFLATTNNIANADFMAGKYNFSIPGKPGASVVNQGTITAQTGGFAALVAPGVRNSGTITARLGKIGLASGNSFSLDFYGDKLITLGLSDSVAANVKDVATGKTLKSLVTNEGRLKADGGVVELSSVAARKVVDSVINNRGVIEANSIGMHNGMIMLGAATASSKPAKAPIQTVKVSGRLSAAGTMAGETGGKVQITGENIALSDATIDASGQNGGGTVLVGGDTGGGHPSPLAAGIAKAALEATSLPTAATVSVDAATNINVSAKANGDGGKAVVWSDQATSFAGTIAARGGAQSGNGGFVETSSHQQLGFTGWVDTGAPTGKSGTLLLDPQDVTIGNAGSWIITPTALQNALSSGDVLISTDDSLTGSGDIAVADNVVWNNSSTLTLSAYRNISIQANLTNTGGADVTLRSDNTGTGIGTVTFANGTKISTSADVSVFYNPTVNPVGSSVNATSYLNPVEDYSSFIVGGANLGAYMLVNTTSDLQNVKNNLAGSYALGRNIDASSTSTAPFSSLGDNTAQFTGIFDGQNQSIDHLKVAASSYAGLFGYVGGTGIVRNLNLTNVNVSAYGHFVGGVAAWNKGTIDTATVTGVVSGGLSYVGGLVGVNQGHISNSHSDASVSGNSSPDGGLVGFNDTAGVITNSYSTGAVFGFTGVATAGMYGGFVGWNRGRIENSYESGDVTGLSQSNIGGLVAVNDGTIVLSYATGAVSGGTNDAIGGLVGYSDGNISGAYATGKISGAGTYIAGLVAYNDGAVTNSHWDEYSTAQGSACGHGNCNAATAITSDPSQLTASNYSFNESAYPGFDFINNWFMIEGATRPFLRSEWSTSIYNAHQLQLVSTNLSERYTLANNVDLGPALAPNSSGAYSGMWDSLGFVPIGVNLYINPFYGVGPNGLSPFTGSLEGNGYQIKNLAVVSPINAGLFGQIGNTGTVQNLDITNASVTQRSPLTNSYGLSAGILTADNQGLVNRVKTSGSVEAQGSIYFNSSDAAGLAASNEGTISQSSSSATMSSHGCAGFVCTNVGSITQSFATGDIYGVSLGGAAGFVGWNTARATISQSYSTGNEFGLLTEMGGFVTTNSGSISESYSVGSINFTGCCSNLPIGSFVADPGSASSGGSGTISRSYWNSDVYPFSDKAVSGSAGLTTAQFKAGLPNGFDPSVWVQNVSINSGYPYLQWQTEAVPTSINPDIVQPVAGPSRSPVGSPNFETLNGVNVYVPPPDLQRFRSLGQQQSGDAQGPLPSTNNPPNASTAQPSRTNSVSSGDITGSIEKDETFQASGSATTISGTMVNTGGHSVPTLSQLDTSIYAPSGKYRLSPTALDIWKTKTGKVVQIPVNQETCLATVYVMIARAFGDANATLGKEMLLNPTASQAAKGMKYDAISSNLPDAVDKSSVSNYKAFDFAALQQSIKSNHLAIIKSKATSASVGLEQHFLLAVGVDEANNAIIANDPWTGTKLEINSSGSISKVLDPKTNQFVDVLDASGATFTKQEALSQQTPEAVKALVADLGVVPGTNGVYRFNALSTFGATAFAVVNAR